MLYFPFDYATIEKNLYGILSGMFKILRIIFCILSAVSVAVAIPLLCLFGLWGLIPVGTALLFGILMFAVKDGNPFKREKPAPKTDFMNTDEENRAIRERAAQGAQKK